ncbi:MAG: YfiR family protein [Acidobacteriota bacterium]
MLKPTNKKFAQGNPRHSRLVKTRRSVCRIILCLSLLLWMPANQFAQSAGEYEIKAAFLYNFAKFVDWPAESFTDAGAPLVVGIVGNDPFGSAIDRLLSGKSANGRPLVVKRLSVGAGLKSCHILFIASSESGRMAQINGAVRGASVLTVGDMESFIQFGGVIQLTREANKVGMVINTDLAERSRLRISSKLLSLAKVVR